MMPCYEARHGRGAIDNVTITGEKVSPTSPVMVPTTATSMGVTENIITRARPKHTSSSGYPLPDQKGQASVEEEYQSQAEHNVVSSVGAGHILGEGAAIFTDMTETMLAALDKQMALSDTGQRPESSSLNKFLPLDKYLVRVKLDQKNVCPCPCLLLRKRISTLTYIYLLLRIIG